MEQIVKTESVLSKKNIVNRVSYIPGGVSLVLSNLVAGEVVPEGTPLTAPASGKRTVCKQAILLTGSTGTALKVTEGSHHFKVGNVVTLGENKIAYTITSITNASGVDTINVGTSIGTVAAGDFIYEAAAETAATDSTFENQPDCVLESAFKVPVSGTVAMQTAEGLLRADVLSGVIATEYLAYLKGVIEVKY